MKNRMWAQLCTSGRYWKPFKLVGRIQLKLLRNYNSTVGEQECIETLRAADSSAPWRTLFPVSHPVPNFLVIIGWSPWRRARKEVQTLPSAALRGFLPSCWWRGVDRLSVVAVWTYFRQGCVPESSGGIFSVILALPQWQGVCNGLQSAHIPILPRE